MGARVVQRLDAEAIARQQKLPARAVPQREREHSLQLLDTALTLLLVGMQDRFGVASSPIPVPARLEAGTQRGVVVYLTVVNDPYRLVFVRHRLVATSDVDDRESSMAETDGPVDEQALAVGSAVAKRIPHALQTRLVHHVSRIPLHDADDPAHRRLTSLRSSAATVDGRTALERRRR